MGVLQHDGTVVNLDALSAIFDTNANGFGPEATRNPDMAGPVLGAQHGMAWNRGYFQNQDIRGSSTGNATVSTGRSGKLPVGNATLPGVTTSNNPGRGA
ncbi:hypothetical protein LCGC14_1199420 [marine sediment metagenome]|uniref:Uncharacterized protein n=1 Tax=marine sediment metagenome TaxID=412755 RepID=A0A0F9LHF7_9ZZZZ